MVFLTKYPKKSPYQPPPRWLPLVLLFSGPDLVYLTCLLLGHPERVALEGDTPAAPLGRGGVHPQKQRRIRGESARLQAAGAAGSDVDEQLVLGVGEHLWEGKTNEYFSFQSLASLKIVKHDHHYCSVFVLIF